MKKVLLSGIQPTGDMHIGNYFGAILQFIEKQNSHESYVFIADLHALTTVQDKEALRKNIFNITATYLACGLDPQKVTLFQQSAIGGELSELTWIFNCITSVPYLMRGHAFKARVGSEYLNKFKDADELFNTIENNENNLTSFDEEMKRIFSGVNVGLFDYPMLMAADILMQDADVVPVGADQRQHVEFARDTAEKFNRIWKEDVFKLPESFMWTDRQTIPGIDGRKMSKSYGNTIPLFASDEEINKAVMSIVTDSSGERPENVYAIHTLFRSESELAALYEENKGKYKILKESLAEDIKSFVRPMREKYLELQANPKIVEEVLSAGGKIVKESAQKKMAAVKKAVGLI